MKRFGLLALVLSGFLFFSQGLFAAEGDSKPEMAQEKVKSMKCGEGKCGEGKMKRDCPANEECKDGKKCGEGKCGKGKEKAGKCGAGKCGAAK